MKYKILFTLSICLILFGCGSQSQVSNTQNQDGVTNTSEVAKGSPDAAKPSIKITKVEVTKKSQEFLGGISAGGDIILNKRAPTKGNVYVIVTVSVDFPTEELSYNSDTDLVLSNSLACGSSLDEEVWVSGCDETDPKLKKGAIVKRIYHIPSDRVRDSKIHFLGTDYPIEPFLSEIPK